MNFIFHNSLYFPSLIIFSLQASFLPMAQQRNKNSFNLTIKRKFFFFSLLSSQDGVVCVKRRLWFLYLLGSLRLLLRCPVICPVSWESSATTLISPAWVFIASGWPHTVGDHGPAMCLVMRSPCSTSSLWSTGPPGSWRGNGEAGAFSCSLCTTVQYAGLWPCPLSLPN